MKGASLHAMKRLPMQGTERPDPQRLVEALVRAEQETKQQRLTYSSQSLCGTWRLWFAANKQSRELSGVIQGRGWYLPRMIKAHLSFATDDDAPGQEAGSETVQGVERLAIANQLQLGPILLKLTGPARYLNRKNLLVFDFTRLELRLFGKILYQGQFPHRSTPEDFDPPAVSKLPFFKFFAITDHLIAARGRGGGLALWVDDSETSQ